MKSKLEIEIETERLLLRMFRPEDIEAACAIWSDPLVMKYLSVGEISREQVEVFLARSREFWDEQGFGQFALVHKEQGKLIGYCGFKFLDEAGEVELLYGLASDYWNRGLVTEAARACLRFAFEETTLARIVAVTQPSNVGSYRVMQKVGMKYEKDTHYQGFDVVYYSITLEEYQPDASPYILRLNQSKDV